MARTAKPKTPPNPEVFLTELATLRATLAETAAAYDKTTALLNAQHAEAVRPLRDREAELVQLLKDWHSSTGAAGMVPVCGGRVGVRVCPPRLSFTASKEWTLKRVQELGRVDLLRTVTELDQRALMQAEPALREQLAVAVTRDQRFVVETK